jgi:nickel/cobalt transporter (NicO) family protein
MKHWLRMLFTHSHPNVGEPTHGHEESGITDQGLGTGVPALAQPPVPSRLTFGLIVWLGVSGGIVPCPAAIWMMLAGIAKGRPAAGLFAVLVFGLGLALTLMAVGFLALSSRRFAERLMGQEGSRRWLLTVLPAIGGAAVTALGMLFIAHYAWRLAFGQTLVSWLG